MAQNLKWGALGNYKAAIERLFIDSLLVAENNVDQFETPLENYVEVLMLYTDSVKTIANYKRQFKLEMMKVALFENLGRDDKALLILNNISGCDHDSIQQVILEKAIQQKAYSVYAKEMGPSWFMHNEDSFELDSTVFEAILANAIDTTGFGTYILGPNSLQFSLCSETFEYKSNAIDSKKSIVVYPNPASDFIHVVLPKSASRFGKADIVYNFEILNLSGQVVHSSSVVGRSNRIDVTQLSSGMYLYRAFDQLSGHSEEGKLVIGQ